MPTCLLADSRKTFVGKEEMMYVCRCEDEPKKKSTTRRARYGVGVGLGLNLVFFSTFPSFGREPRVTESGDDCKRSESRQCNRSTTAGNAMQVDETYVVVGVWWFSCLFPPERSGQTALAGTERVSRAGGEPTTAQSEGFRKQAVRGGATGARRCGEAAREEKNERCS